MSDLPKGWAEVPLGTFSSATRNVDPSAHLETVFELYSVPAYANGVPDVAAGAEIGSTKQVVLPGDVLLCKIIPHLNRVWSIPESKEHQQIASPEWLVYRDHGCVPDYLRAALSEPVFREKFLQTKSGVGGSLTRARTDLVNQIKINIAPLPEQRRIVTKVDGLTARTARARKELDRIPTLIARYKQRLLAMAFSGELTAGWRKKNGTAANISSHPNGLWEAPAAWEWRRVDEVGKVGLGRQRSPKNHEGPDMRPYMRSANITWKGIDTSDVKEMNFDAKDFERFQLKYGDVLLNEGSGSAKEVGKPAIWRDEIPNCCYQNTILRVQPEKCSSEYLYWYFLLTAMSERFVDSTKGMNIQHISKDGLARYMVPVPAPEEQAEIVRRIESAFGWLDRMAVDHIAAARLLPKLDAAILARAFRGELVPQDPSDEPAHVLLERIKAERAAVSKVKRGRTGKLAAIEGSASDTINITGTATATVGPERPRKSSMTKSRQDDDIKGKPYLAGLLKSGRFSEAQNLFRAADLPVADFYKQLAWEIDQGHILDSADELRAA